MIGRHPSRASRGQVLVLFALGLVVLVGIAAITVDYGYWLQEKRSLQNAADAAAQAGVSELLKRPITADKQSAAARHALAYVDDQLGLGLRATGQFDCAATAAADPSGDGFGPEDGCTNYTGTNYTGPDRIVIRTPVDAASSCRGVAWGNRAVTVRVERASTRFFSRIYGGGDPRISVCATSAIQGGSLAVAVLKPNQTAPGVYATQPSNSTITMSLAGSDSFVRIWGGDIGVNSLFSAAGAPPPTSPNEPAYVKFMTAGPSGISDNHMLLTIDNPSPPTWDVIARQVRTEGPTPAEADDPYHAPIHLPGYLPIPGWGNDRYAALNATDAGTSPTTLAKGDPANGTCHDPLTGQTGVAPGKYNLIEVDTGARRWLCPGVFHFVHRNGSQGLQLASNSTIAGQGVTLVFESDSAASVSSGGALLLNCDPSADAACGSPQAAAPWTTDDVRHDIPIAIWIRPVPGCDPLQPACSDTVSSSVFVMSGGAGMNVRGLIYGPTDKMKIAGNGAHHGSGEIWAWTLEYKGNSTLDQVYEGGDDGYPLIVE